MGKTAKKKINRDLVLYVIVRNDLDSMTPGKAEAHSGHAASLFGHIILTRHELTDSHINDYLEWAGDRGFGTQINLDGNLDDMNQIYDEIEKSDTGDSRIIYAPVVDPTYPYQDGNNFFTRKETTAMFIFGSKKDLFPFVGRFSLK